MAARYTYDPLDRRIGIQDNGIQTWVVWDSPQPYADFNGSGTLQERYLYGPAVDEVLARTDSVGTTSWYLTDRAGSIRNLADSSGTVTGTISYDGFGKQLGSSGAVDRFGYTGREYDPTTGLQSNRERYYDAALGRWTQEDKIGFAGEDANLERYVGNSPTNASDPSGLDAFDYVPIFGGLFAFMDYLSTQKRESARGRALDEQRAQFNLANNPSQGPYENRALESVQGQLRAGMSDRVNGRSTADAISEYPDALTSLKTDLIRAAAEESAMRGAGHVLAALPPIGKIRPRKPGANFAPSKCPAPNSGKLNPPNATDLTLQDTYKNLWRPQDVRPGGTISELLREAEAGGPLKHLEKAKGRLRQLLDRVNDTSRPLSPADRAGAERVINDLKDAIRTSGGR